MYHIVTQSNRKIIIRFLNRGDALYWMSENDPNGELYIVVNTVKRKIGSAQCSTPTTTVDDASRKP